MGPYFRPASGISDGGGGGAENRHPRQSVYGYLHDIGFASDRLLYFFPGTGGGIPDPPEKLVGLVLGHALCCFLAVVPFLDILLGIAERAKVRLVDARASRCSGPKCGTIAAFPGGGII